MTDLIPFIPYFIASYVLIFACGYVFGAEKYKKKGKEIAEGWVKYATQLRQYDKEGRVRNWN